MARTCLPCRPTRSCWTAHPVAACCCRSSPRPSSDRSSSRSSSARATKGLAKAISRPCSNRSNWTRCAAESWPTRARAVPTGTPRVPRETVMQQTVKPVVYGASERPPRGDYAKARPDYTCEQDWDAYTAEEHDRFRRLFTRQFEHVQGRACDEFVAALGHLSAA